MGLRSGLCRPVKLFPTDLDKPFFIWTSLCARGHCHVETGKALPQTVTTKLEAQLSRMSLYAVALRFPFAGTKGPRPNHGKKSPRPLFLIHQTLQLALCIGAGSILLASAKPRFVGRGSYSRHTFDELICWKGGIL